MIFRSDDNRDPAERGRAWLSWIRQNPLKISGIAGFVAEVLVMATGEDVGSLSLFMAGFFGMTACLTLWAFGRGGDDGAVGHHGGGGQQDPSAWLMKMTRQGLLFWRYPAESSAFQQGLCGLAFIIAGILQGVWALGFTGICCIGMAVVVNCLPTRTGWRNPMMLGAMMQGLATINVIWSALELQSWVMGLAALGYIINDVAFGLSLRHDNGA
ncbi:MAG: hypothetical protein JO126_05010 [Alphaproteobacteria bacterium]|nr:hypothetical protein [Alphaproteobacteria bacterium]